MGIDMRRILFLAMAVAGIALLSGCEAPTELTVNSTADVADALPGDGVCETAVEDQCTLRAAVMEANALGSAVTIQLTPGSTYTLSGANSTDDDVGAVGDLDVTGELTIEGNGATLRTSADIRLVDNLGTLALHELTLSSDNNSNLSPSLVRNQGGATMESVALSGAFTSSGAIHQVSGGLVLDNGHVQQSTIGLTVDGGQAIVVDSSIHDTGCIRICPELPAVGQTGGELIVINSTVSVTNRTVSYGCPSLVCFAGVTGYGLRQLGGSATLVRSTVVSNRIGIAGDDITLLGTAVASNTDADCSGTATSLGYNLDEDSTCLATPNTGDRPSTPAALASLLSGQAHAVPLASSALLDQIPVGTPYLCDGQHPVDQRGLPRPAGAACDIGAIERQPTDP
jgi:hypothetical protein